MAGLSASRAVKSPEPLLARTACVLVFELSRAGEGDAFDALVGVPLTLGGRDDLLGVLCRLACGVEMVRCLGAREGGENSVADDVVIDVVL